MSPYETTERVVSQSEHHLTQTVEDFRGRDQRAEVGHRDRLAMELEALVISDTQQHLSQQSQTNRRALLQATIRRRNVTSLAVELRQLLDLVGMGFATESETLRLEDALATAAPAQQIDARLWLAELASPSDRVRWHLDRLRDLALVLTEPATCLHAAIALWWLADPILAGGLLRRATRGGVSTAALLAALEWVETRRASEVDASFSLKLLRATETRLAQEANTPSTVRRRKWVMEVRRAMVLAARARRGQTWAVHG